MYVSDDASNTSAPLPLLVTTSRGPTLLSSHGRHDDDDDDDDDDAAHNSDDKSLGTLSRSSSVLGDHTADDFNPDGVFDTPRDTPPESDNEEGMEDWLDIDKDPLFETSELLFDNISESGSGALEPDSSLPPALDEDPLIRNACVTAYLFAACHGSTQETIKALLDCLHESFTAMERENGKEMRGLSMMARTLQTAERRLRIDPNQYIVYYFLCNVCWALHHPSSLDDLDSPSCTTPGCTGQVYTLKELTDGRHKRTPLRVLPTAPIIPMIQRFLLRPGKYEEFQHWRVPGLDNVGDVAPLHEPADPLDAYDNVHWIMGDITDGWGWRAVSWGLERRKVSSAVSPWGVEDVLVEEKRQRFVSLPCGLLLSINIDWYVILLVCSITLMISFILGFLRQNAPARTPLAQSISRYSIIHDPSGSCRRRQYFIVSFQDLKSRLWSNLIVSRSPSS